VGGRTISANTQAAEASLKRLGGDAIGLYQFHRPDPSVPYANSIGALHDLLDAGTIRMAGISNADPDQIHLANDILGGRLVSVQNQYSPAFGSSEPEVRLCHELGIAFLPWSPLGGITAASGLGDRRAALPRPAASARSRSVWRGCWPRHRTSSPSRAHRGPRLSATPRGRPNSNTHDEITRLDH